MKKMAWFGIVLMLTLVAACSSGNQSEVKPTVQPIESPASLAATDEENSAIEQPAEQASDEVGSEFEVVLVDPGTKLLEIVKVIRDSRNLSLAESKAIVDGAPAMVATGLNKEEATILKAELEAAGATVELKETERSGSTDGEETGIEVVLVDPGTKKLEVVKVIRDNRGLDLAGSKKIVDEAPATVATGLSKEEADMLRAELEAAGATVEFK